MCATSLNIRCARTSSSEPASPVLALPRVRRLERRPPPRWGARPPRPAFDIRPTTLRLRQRPARAADDQRRGQIDPFDLPVGMRNELQQHTRRATPHLFERLTDGREWWVDIGGGRDVVETDDRDVVGDAEPTVADRVDDAKC